ncbi:hypothetical protein KP509_01G055700 [Ceratopteris richardii]|uniref:Secreted protein n=1 Tax=Ceratopteris richardii TaxID=49495 RepID=A0A8T2VDA1_CERRI|nr:hypothetical protein KP509_01G055700 [Ceratopteris richardii]
MGASFRRLQRWSSLALTLSLMQRSYTTDMDSVSTTQSVKSLCLTTFRGTSSPSLKVKKCWRRIPASLSPVLLRGAPLSLSLFLSLTQRYRSSATAEI